MSERAQRCAEVIAALQSDCGHEEHNVSDFVRDLEAENTLHRNRSLLYQAHEKLAAENARLREALAIARRHVPAEHADEDRIDAALTTEEKPSE